MMAGPYNGISSVSMIFIAIKCCLFVCFFLPRRLADNAVVCVSNDFKKTSIAQDITKK